MRPILSLLLLCLVSFHWIGGHIYFRVLNTKEVKFLMSEIEENLSASIQAETGIQAEIEVLKDDSTIEEIGYSGVFVFSKKINGESHRYIVKSQPQFSTKEIILNTTSNLPDDLQNKIFGKLFPKLFNSIANLETYNYNVEMQSTIDSRTKPMKSQCYHTIPFPPPNTNC